MALTSIYNFVPLNEYVYHPDWADKVTQDAPFSDGEDGIIEVTLRNLSPLFIRNGCADRDSQDPHSAHVVMKDGKRLYFLPGTSLKGMLRSTMEIMSFGKMTEGKQYINRFFGKRDIGNDKQYVAKMQDVRPGWLRMEGDKMSLTPCNGQIERISDSELAEKYPGFAKEKTGWGRNCAIAKASDNKMYPIYKMNNGTEYRIVCTGDIGNKNAEYLLPCKTDSAIKIKDERVRESFFTVHEPSPDFEKIVAYLKSGGELAVSYLLKNGKEVDAIGISRMMRYPYKDSIRDIVERQQPVEYESPDLAELVFGYISDDKNDSSLRGRVQIGNAFAQEPISDNDLLPKVEGVLGQPKASFYPFYLKQDKNPYKTYDDATGIAGRKLYRVHEKATTTDLPQGNGNGNTTSRFIPIPEGQTFTLRIAVHNLRKVETGALLSALTLHETQGAWHNIGLARGYGYGKLEIEKLTLKGFKYTEDDYLKEFETEMSVFTYAKRNTPWTKTEQIKTLMAILGEHEDACLRILQLQDSDKNGKRINEYVQAKRNFDKLTEGGATVNTYTADTDFRKIKNSTYQERLKIEAEFDKHYNVIMGCQHKACELLELLGTRYDEETVLQIQQQLGEIKSQMNDIPKETNKNKIQNLLNDLKVLKIKLSEKKAEHLHLTAQSLLNELKEKFDTRKVKEIELMFEKIIKKCDFYIDLCGNNGQDFSYYVNLKTSVRNEQKILENIRKLNAGLAAELDKMGVSGTPTEGKYLVVEYKQMANSIKNWLKKAKSQTLTDSEKEAYAATFHRLFPTGCHPKKEDKSLADKNSKIWKEAQLYLGDRFDELLGDIYKQ